MVVPGRPSRPMQVRGRQRAEQGWVRSDWSWQPLEDMVLAGEALGQGLARVAVPGQRQLRWTDWQGSQRTRLSRRAPPGARTLRPPGCASQNVPQTPHALHAARLAPCCWQGVRSRRGMFEGGSVSPASQGLLPQCTAISARHTGEAMVFLVVCIAATQDRQPCPAEERPVQLQGQQAAPPPVEAYPCTQPAELQSARGAATFSTWRARLQAQSTEDSPRLSPSGQQVRLQQREGAGRDRAQFVPPQHKPWCLGVCKQQVLLQPTLCLGSQL